MAGAGAAFFLVSEQSEPIAAAKPEQVAFAENGTNSASAEFLSANGRETGVETTASGLQYRVLEAGDANGSPGPTDYVLVNYTGRIPGGETFDSGEQVPMPLDAVVSGFSEGIQLMSRGARHRIWVPPALGYGASPPPNSPIGADTVMEFDIDLIDFITRERFDALQREAREQAGQ